MAKLAKTEKLEEQSENLRETMKAWKKLETWGENQRESQKNFRTDKKLGTKLSEN